jgi:hypothetical protein
VRPNHPHAIFLLRLVSYHYTNDENPPGAPETESGYATRASPYAIPVPRARRLHSTARGLGKYPNSQNVLFVKEQKLCNTFLFCVELYKCVNKYASNFMHTSCFGGARGFLMSRVATSHEQSDSALHCTDRFCIEKCRFVWKRTDARFQFIHGGVVEQISFRKTALDTAR